MVRYWVINRIGRGVLTILVVVSLSFGLIRQMPGGPVEYLKAQAVGDPQATMDTERLEQLAEIYYNMAPNKPIWEQYIDYMASVMLEFDLGQSSWYDAPVEDILLAAMPWTVFISAVTLLIATTIGIIFGGLTAYYEQSRFDEIVSVTGFFSSSIPFYIIALVLILFLGFEGPFPTANTHSPLVDPGFNVPFIASAMWHAVLPVLSLTIARFGGFQLSMRANSISILGSDYMRVADLRGLSEQRKVFRYVSYNSILPFYTSLLISIGGLFGGSVILENIFTYPGVGFYMFKAIETRDYILMMGGLVMLTTTVIAGIVIADLTYGLVDPRIGGEDREAY